MRECRKLNDCKTEEAKITGAYKLYCEYVICTVGPVWNGSRNSKEEKLANCYRNSMKLAAENGIKTIVFPSISTRIYRFLVDKAAKIAVSTVKQFLDKIPERLMK